MVVLTQNYFRRIMLCFLMEGHILRLWLHKICAVMFPPTYCYVKTKPNRGTMIIPAVDMDCESSLRLQSKVDIL